MDAGKKSDNFLKIVEEISLGFDEQGKELEALKVRLRPVLETEKKDKDEDEVEEKKAAPIDFVGLVKFILAETRETNRKIARLNNECVL